MQDIAGTAMLIHILIFIYIWNNNLFYLQELLTMNLSQSIEKHLFELYVFLYALPQLRGRCMKLYFCTYL